MTAPTLPIYPTTDYPTGSGMEFINNSWVFTGPKGYRVVAQDDGTFNVVSYTVLGDRQLGWTTDGMTQDAAHEMAARLAKS